MQPHYDVLYRVAYRLTRSRHDAEDLAQEVCVRAYPRLAELEQLEQPRGWLLRVMYRLFIDWSRRYERAHVASIEVVDVLNMASEEPGPVDLAERDIDARPSTARGFGSIGSSGRCSRCTTSKGTVSRRSTRSRESSRGR